jgi:hypothetical protein
MQFIGSPALADVDGDGVAETLNGSGAYQVRAYRADGSSPGSWPKFTHGWHISSPTPGDVDGDGKIEVVAVTREGNLYVWDTPADASETALPWAGFGRDRRNTKSNTSGVSNLAAAVDPLAGLGWELEGIRDDAHELAATLPPQDASYLTGCCLDLLIGQALAAIADSRDFRTAQRLPGIEWSLRLPGHPIPALAPIHARFSAAVRATAVREIAAAQCAPGDATCARKRVLASQFLGRGDAATDPRTKVFYWSRAIALW